MRDRGNRGENIADRLLRLGAKLLTAIALIYFLMPILISTYAGLLPSLDLSPLNGFTLRWFGAVLDRDLLDAFRVSVIIASLSVTIGVLLALPAAYALVRFDFAGRGLVNILLLSPIMIPGVARGLSLIFYFGLIGVYDAFMRLLLAHITIALPYAIRVIYPAYFGLDPNLEHAARGLGAGPIATFFRVTLPLVKPGIFAAVIFGFAMSMIDVPISVFLIEAGTNTLPVLFLTYSRHYADPTLFAISTVLVLLAFITAAVTQKVAGLERIVGGVR